MTSSFMSTVPGSGVSVEASVLTSVLLILTSVSLVLLSPSRSAPLVAPAGVPGRGTGPPTLSTEPPRRAGQPASTEYISLQISFGCKRQPLKRTSLGSHLNAVIGGSLGILD